MSTERLQKILARHGLGSRRHAEQLIREGRIHVDGVIAKLGQRTDPDVAYITFDGDPLPPLGPPLTLILHKPRGVIVTASDERGRTTVFELLDNPPANLRQVGRLDRDSEGLLILTTNGELAHRLMHPRYRVNKTYAALVQGLIRPETIESLRIGIELDDGPTAPSNVKLLCQKGDDWWVQLVIHEGRNRQVRRMFYAVGHPVLRLIRTSVAGLTLDKLEAGESRPLTSSEELTLADSVGLVDPAEKRSISSNNGTDDQPEN